MDCARSSFPLEDGTPITYNLDLNTKKDHLDYCREFCEEHNIDYSYCNSHKAFGKLLSSLGIIIVFNSGIPTDGKYLCGIYLPEQMSSNQIAFLENTKSLFKEKYHENVSYFNPRVYTSLPNNFTYKLEDSCRNLKIESIIANENNENGQELLYLEVEKQKTMIENRKK